jgi:hypothetical protein
MSQRFIHSFIHLLHILFRSEILRKNQLTQSTANPDIVGCKYWLFVVISI